MSFAASSTYFLFYRLQRSNYMVGIASCPLGSIPSLNTSTWFFHTEYRSCQRKIQHHESYCKRTKWGKQLLTSSRPTQHSKYPTWRKNSFIVFKYVQKPAVERGGASSLSVPWIQGVTKRCRLSWVTNSALVYEPECEGKGRVAGPQPMSSAVHHCTRSPNNFGDLTPYLSYAWIT